MVSSVLRVRDFYHVSVSPIGILPIVPSVLTSVELCFFSSCECSPIGILTVESSV